MDTIIFYMENKTELCIRHVKDWSFSKNEVSGKLTGFKIECGEDNNAQLPYIDLDKVIAVKVVKIR